MKTETANSYGLEIYSNETGRKVVALKEGNCTGGLTARESILADSEKIIVGIRVCS